MSKILVTLYFLLSTVLAIYSYGFLDFNLTLSSHPIFLQLVSPLQSLVYFARPTSALVYSLIFGTLFIVYLVTLFAVSRSLITRFAWRPLLLIVFMLTISYPMLSYDVFNYMFHSKILWFYHANPHLVAPLSFEGDLWLRFMRWVHTPSAYGPVFTAVESPAYLLGIGKFVPTLYLMKVTMSLFYLWCIHLVGQIATILKYKSQVVVMLQYLIGANPFLYLELVINSHNDTVMVALLLLAIKASLSSKKIISWLSLLLSVGVKYVTALAAPALLINSPQLKILLTTSAMLIPVLISPNRFQPWYLTWSLIPAVLINHNGVRSWIILGSLAGLIYYIPYIYTGFWNNSIAFVSFILYAPLMLSLIYIRLTKKS